MDRHRHDVVTYMYVNVLASSCFLPPVPIVLSAANDANADAMCHLSDLRAADVDRNLCSIFWTNGNANAAIATLHGCFWTTDDPAHSNDAPSFQCQVPRREEGLRLPLQACPHRRFRRWQVLPPSAICREFIFFLRYRAFCLAKIKKMTRGTDGEPRRWNTSR